MADDTTVNVNNGPRHDVRRNRPCGNMGANKPPASVAPFHARDASLAPTWSHSDSSYNAWQMDQPAAPGAMLNALTEHASCLYAITGCPMGYYKYKCTC